MKKKLRKLEANAHIIWVREVVGCAVAIATVHMAKLYQRLRKKKKTDSNVRFLFV